MASVDPLEQVGDETGIAPGALVAVVVGLSHYLTEFQPGGAGEVVAILPNPATGDFHQLVDGEVGKLKAVGEARVQSGVEAQQFQHFFLVPAKDNGQIAVILVSQQIHQQLDDQLAWVVGMRSGEQVGLINHQNTATGHLNHLIDGTLFISPVRANEGAAVANHHMALAENAGVLKQRPQDACHGGLTRTRSAEKDAVLREFVFLASWIIAAHQPIIAGHIHQLIHPLLDIGATHQLIQFLPRIVERQEHLHLHLRIVVLLDDARRGLRLLWFLLAGQHTRADVIVVVQT